MCGEDQSPIHQREGTVAQKASGVKGHHILSAAAGTSTSEGRSLETILERHSKVSKL